MRKWINMYFGFSKREYNGLIVLIVLIGVVMVIPTLYEWLHPVKANTEAENKALRELKLVMSNSAFKDKNENIKSRSKVKDISKRKVSLFKFDPNTISAVQWESLGLSYKQAISVLKYIEKGGRFRETADLKKMYTISDEIYEQIAPFVIIQKTDGQTREKTVPSYVKQEFKNDLYPANKPVIVEINAADTIELDKIKGIGPAFARRIYLYRQRLGGFYKKEQLMEVFGLDSLKFNEIKGQITLNPLRIIKVNINIAEFDDLKNHPYLKYKQVNAIIQFRKQHGKYGNIADLNKVAILNSEIIEKLAPYISF